MITNDDIDALRDTHPLDAPDGSDRVKTHTIQRLWLSGFVHRWHSNDDWRLRESRDINGGHCQRVAILYACLFQPTVEGLLCALLHDAGEVLSGDVAAPAKRRVPALGEGDRQAASIYFSALGIHNWSAKSDEIALCDLLDAIMFCSYRAPDLIGRDDWQQDIHACLDMAAKLKVRAQVWSLIHWHFRHGID